MWKTLLLFYLLLLPLLLLLMPLSLSECYEVRAERLDTKNPVSLFRGLIAAAVLYYRSDADTIRKISIFLSLSSYLHPFKMCLHVLLLLPCVYAADEDIDSEGQLV